MPGKRRVLALLAAFLAAGATGCMQLEARVRLHEDGSATITERLRLSRAVLDQAGNKQAELVKLLDKEAALERMKRMGKGLTLVRHELRDAAGGSKESLAEFRIEDLNDFQYVSHWPSFADYPENNVVKCQLEPMYKNGSSGGEWWAGSIRVRFVLLKRPKGVDDGKDPKAPPEKGPSPRDQQVFRELGPVFRDLLKDFQVKLTFESYCPLLPLGGTAGIRNLRAGATSTDFINFTSEDLDNWGGRFLENEEIMLELVRWDTAGRNISTNVQNYASNHTLPVFMPRRRSEWFGGSWVYVTPSRQLFDRYFKGKELDYRPWRKEPPAPADFERIGWKGPAKKPEGKTEVRKEEEGK